LSDKHNVQLRRDNNCSKYAGSAEIHSSEIEAMAKTGKKTNQPPTRAASVAAWLRWEVQGTLCGCFLCLHRNTQLMQPSEVLALS